MKWSGDWSDDSPLWSEYPGVAFEIGRKHKEDGIFWMCWYAHGMMMMIVVIIIGMMVMAVIMKLALFISCKIMKMYEIL